MSNRGWLLPLLLLATTALAGDGFDEVRQTVVNALEARGRAGRQAVLDRADVHAVIMALEREGWTVRESDALADRALPEGDWLARTLRSGSGARFAAQVLGHGGRIDQIERLSKMPQGRQTIDDLIRSPGGYKLMEYLAKSPGGQQLGKMLSKCRNGADFNCPTGRLYTSGDLIDEFQRRYQAQ